VAAVLSWRYSFWVLAIPGLFLAVAIWRLLPEPARGGMSRLAAGAEAILPAEQVDDDRSSADCAEPRDGSPPADDEGQLDREVQEQHIAPHSSRVLHEDPIGGSLWWAMRYVLSVRTNLTLIVGSALGYFFFSGLRTFAVVFLRDRFAIGQSEATTLLVVLGAGAVVGVLLTGRIGDWLIGRHHITARPVVAGLSFLFAAVLFLPALLTTSLLVAAPLLFFAAAGVGGANPPLDAARLDLMHHSLWGRAEAARTVLRSSFEAVAPLLFGYVSTQFGGHTNGLGHPTGSAGSRGGGLDHAFLIMLVPLAVAGLLILLRARASYPRDVATAVASEHATRLRETRRLRS